MTIRKLAYGLASFACAAIISVHAFAAVTLQATPGQQFYVNGTAYSANSNGLISNVATDDALQLIKAGAFYPATAITGKTNLAATADPAATDDSTKGYGVGSRWINTTAGTSFQLVDATASAAIW